MRYRHLLAYLTTWISNFSSLPAGRHQSHLDDAGHDPVVMEGAGEDKWRGPELHFVQEIPAECINTHGAGDRETVYF